MFASGRAGRRFGDGSPELGQHAGGAFDRVAPGRWDGSDIGADLTKLARNAPAKIGGTAARISSDDEQPAGRAFVAMRHARGDRDGVARHKATRGPSSPPKRTVTSPAAMPEHLVRVRMEVVEIIDAVAPGPAPSVLIEQPLEDAAPVAAFGHAAPDQQRQRGM